MKTQKLRQLGGMRLLFLLILATGAAGAQDLGLRRLTHDEIVEMVEGSTVLFASKGNLSMNIMANSMMALPPLPFVIGIRALLRAVLN